MIGENIKAQKDKMNTGIEAVHEMTYTAMLSPAARKCLDGLDNKRAKNIKKHLKELEKDPFKPRAGCDIDIVAGSDRPPMYRLRIGEFRVTYFVEGNEIYVTEFFLKRRDSAYKEH